MPRPPLRRPAAAVLVLVAVLVSVLMAVLAGCDASSSTPDPPDPPPPSAARPAPTASPPALLPAVGALFRAGSAEHTCSAAVVDSASGDVVLTAAHCFSGTGRDLRFVPGYGPSGSGPSGSWTVRAAYAPTAWLEHRDPRSDYAFLRVVPADPSRSAGRGRPQTLEGAVGSAGSPGPAVAGAPVVVAGYATGADDPQIVCAATVQPAGGAASDPSVRCGALGGGTSGGPWIRGGDGTPTAGGLVGLVGGLHQGGCTDAVTYSPLFGAGTTALLRRADAGGPGDVLPSPGDDGC